MRRATVVSHLRAAELRERMLASETRQQFQRWQVIYATVTKGFRAEEVADLVGVAKGTVHQWVHQYNHRGPQALDLQGRGGRRSALLSWEEEETLLEELSESAKHGRVVIAQTVREWAEKKVGRRISKDYAYDLLHRHGWRKLAPRPRHPKGDAARQEEFKKNFPPLWRPPSKTSKKRTTDH